MDKHEDVMHLFDRFEREFGQALAGRIIEVMLHQIGGMRLSIPDVQDLCRQERNRRIRNQFNGSNHGELALRHGLTERQVRRIILRG